MTWNKHMNKTWNQVSLHAYCSWICCFFFLLSANSFTLVYQKFSLRGNGKHPLLSPTFFLPVCLLNAPPSWFVWTSRASSGQGRFTLRPWAHLRASHHWAAPIEPGPVGRVILPCTGKYFQTLETSDNSSYRKMPSGASWGIIWQASHL